MIRQYSFVNTSIVSVNRLKLYNIFFFKNAKIIWILSIC